MIKKILKMFMKPEKLAQYAAEGIAKAVNNSDRHEQIVKYNEMAAKAAEVQTWITDVLTDGRIDDLEKEQIAERLEPLFKRIVELI